MDNLNEDDELVKAEIPETPEVEQVEEEKLPPEEEFENRVIFHFGEENKESLVFLSVF